MQIFEVKSENGKVKGERLKVRGGNKTERNNMPLGLYLIGGLLYKFAINGSLRP